MTKTLCLTFAFWLCPAYCAADDPKSSLVVHDISFWVFDTSCENVNDRTVHPSALPGLADSLRSRDIPGIKEPVSPYGIMTFSELATGKLDVDLQLKAGRFLADWPAGERKSKRIRWSQIGISSKVADESRVVFVGDHWFNNMRSVNELMYLSTPTRTERFLCYDAELKAPMPVKLTGGPEKYKVSNLTSNPIYDLVISVPTSKGRQLAWLDALPAGKLKSKQPAGAAKGAGNKPVAPTAKADSKKDASKETKASDKKQDAKKADDKKEAAKPAQELNAQQKQVEERLSKPITLKYEGAALEDVLDFFRSSQGVEIRVSEEAKRDFPNPRGPAVTINEKNVKGNEALKKLLAVHELVYEIENQGIVMVTPEDAKTKPAVGAGNVEPGPEVELALGPVIAESNVDAMAKERGQWKARLKKTGLSQAEVDLVNNQFGKSIFESKDLIVSGRFDAATIEEHVPLEVLPIPAKLTRVPLMLMRNVDPRLKAEVLEQIAKLGDPKYLERESAEKRLIELGMVAVPELKSALANTDVEVVFRAERILEALGQQLPEEKKPTPAK